MTREQAENRIKELLAEVNEIMVEYSPDYSYLSMCIINADGFGAMSFNNAYWENEDHQINAQYRMEGGEWV